MIPRHLTDRLFLDANILFSVAYLPQSNTSQLWDRDDVVLLTSEYAVAEARRNLKSDGAINNREDLLEQVNHVPTPAQHDMELPVDPPEKDHPILSSALYGNPTHLITGDKQDFGERFGKTIGNLTIMRPAGYLDEMT